MDDSPRFIAAARRRLEGQGLTVPGTASTGAEALRLAAELRPDVVLVDIDLRGESGFELARRLDRQTGTLAPVVLISTHAEEDYADLVAASPAVGFLAKAVLSAGAIRDLLDGRSAGTPVHPVSEPPVSEPPGT